MKKYLKISVPKYNLFKNAKNAVISSGSKNNLTHFLTVSNKDLSKCPFWLSLIIEQKFHHIENR
jgi:hypothetical protein